ncbi:MAG: tRNA pseudouridine(55) synthase TruB [Candidatus Omnitrophica bacterium]|jgi:tRNA pseudouridine55 synthase|nr:tRNA pseudouridine(55) synthase TruB [Candidatus Omnitrophota bacterium]
MEGFININKPSGITSYDVIRFIKKVFHPKEKLGHTGTLDPLASGVLVICAGRATKFSHFFLNMDKEYITTMELGKITDTDDVDGKVLETRSINNITSENIKEVVRGFLGEINQVPPIVSALKLKGEKSYNLYRKGENVVLLPRKVHIKEIEIVDIKIPEVKIRVVCSRGTYMRSLCRDIGEKLGCGATQSELLRTRVGKFTIKDSITLEELAKHPFPHYILPLSFIK